MFNHSESGKRNQLAAEVISRFMSYYRNSSDKNYVDEYIKRSMVVGHDIEVHVHGDIRLAHALAIDEECGLMVRYEHGTAETLRFGEVRIKGIY